MSPDTLHGLGPSRGVLVFGRDSKVYREQTPEQDVPRHLSSLMGPVGGNHTTGPQHYQVIQNQPHLSCCSNAYRIEGFSQDYLLPSICLLRCFVLFMFALIGLSVEKIETHVLCFCRQMGNNLIFNIF